MYLVVCSRHITQPPSIGDLSTWFLYSRSYPEILTRVGWSWAPLRSVSQMPPGFLHHHTDGHPFIFLYWIPSSPQFTASSFLTSTPILVALTSCIAPNMSFEEHFWRTCWPKLSLIYHHTSLILQLQELLILLPVSPLQGAGNPRLVRLDTVASGTAVPVFWLPTGPRCQPWGDSPHCSSAHATAQPPSHHLHRLHWPVSAPTHIHT